MDKIKIIRKEPKLIVQNPMSLESNKDSKDGSDSKDNKTKLSEFFANCRSVADFEKIMELGEGTYGTVCMKY